MNKYLVIYDSYSNEEPIIINAKTPQDAILALLEHTGDTLSPTLQKAYAALSDADEAVELVEATKHLQIRYIAELSAPIYQAPKERWEITELFES